MDARFPPYPIQGGAILDACTQCSAELQFGVQRSAELEDTAGEISGDRASARPRPSGSPAPKGPRGPVPEFASGILQFGATLSLSCIAPDSRVAEITA